MNWRHSSAGWEGESVMDYEIRTVGLLEKLKDQPTFSEYATEIRITDEAAGEFVEQSQTGHTDLGKVCISPRNGCPVKAIDQMVKQSPTLLNDRSPLPRRGQ